MTLAAVVTAATLALGSPVDVPDPAVVAFAKTTRLGLALAYVADHPGLWYRVALAHGDTATVWPRGVLPVAVLSSGDTLRALEAFVLQPPPGAGLVRLGAGPVLIEPGRVWREPWRREGMRTKLLVRFPLPPGDTRIVGVRPDVRLESPRPYTRQGGSP